MLRINSGRGTWPANRRQAWSCIPILLRYSWGELRNFSSMGIGAVNRSNISGSVNANIDPLSAATREILCLASERYAKTWTISMISSHRKKPFPLLTTNGIPASRNIVSNVFMWVYAKKSTPIAGSPFSIFSLIDRYRRYSGASLPSLPNILPITSASREASRSTLLCPSSLGTLPF
ncbi:hypothetical protein ES703_88371 [subsurface metagenome]